MGSNNSSSGSDSSDWSEKEKREEEIRDTRDRIEKEVYDKQQKGDFKDQWGPTPELLAVTEVDVKESAKEKMDYHEKESEKFEKWSDSAKETVKAPDSSLEKDAPETAQVIKDMISGFGDVCDEQAKFHHDEHDKDEDVSKKSSSMTVQERDEYVYGKS